MMPMFSNCFVCKLFLILRWKDSLLKGEIMINHLALFVVLELVNRQDQILFIRALF